MLADKGLRPPPEAVFGGGKTQTHRLSAALPGTPTFAPTSSYPLRENTSRQPSYPLRRPARSPTATGARFRNRASADVDSHSGDAMPGSFRWVRGRCPSLLFFCHHAMDYMAQKGQDSGTYIFEIKVTEIIQYRESLYARPKVSLPGLRARKEQGGGRRYISWSRNRAARKRLRGLSYSRELR